MSAIANQFHEIKKSACQIIVQIGECAPKALEDKTEPLLKALLPNINHSHFRVSSFNLLSIISRREC